MTLVMQKWIIVGTSIIAIALFTMAVIFIQSDTKIAAESDVKDHTIEVIGTATTEIKPDRLFITLGVETIDTTSTDALNQNNKQMESTINAIKEIGIQESEFSTSQFNIYPKYDYDQRIGDSILIGYKVTNTIQIDTEKTHLVSEIIDVAVDAGANNFKQLSFGISPQVVADIQYDLISEAALDAKRKGSKIAQSLGVDIIGVKYASLYQDVPYQNPSVFYAEARSATPIFSDNQEIIVSINVIFLTEKWPVNYQK